MLARGLFLDVALIIVGQTSCLAGLDYVWMPLDASNLFVSAAYHGVDDEVAVVRLRNPHYSYGHGNAIPSVPHELMLALLAPYDQHVSIERKEHFFGLV
jgi:hypothetical protein